MVKQQSQDWGQSVIAEMLTRDFKSTCSNHIPIENDTTKGLPLGRFCSGVLAKPLWCDFHTP